MLLVALGADSMSVSDKPDPESDSETTDDDSTALSLLHIFHPVRFNNRGFAWNKQKYRFTILVTTILTVIEENTGTAL